MIKKEWKRLFFSVPFLLAVLFTFLFYETQLEGYLSPGEKITAPLPGGSYGTVPSEDPERIMPAAIACLLQDFSENRYQTYPFGFYRQVSLSEADREKMADILTELTGISKEQLFSVQGEQEKGLSLTPGASGTPVPKAAPSSPFPIKKDLSFERFLSLMEQADALLGGGSSYAPGSLKNLAPREKTYEEALLEYEQARDIDRFSGSHARLFCDYMTVLYALIPAFLAVSQWLGDRRAGVHEILFSKPVSSLRLCASRYFAVVSLSLFPLLLLGVIDSFRAADLYRGEAIDALAYLKYIFGWALPTILFSAAFGQFFTLLTDTPVGIPVALLFWVFDLNRNLFQMEGGYRGLPLSPRHNQLMGAQVFQKNFSQLLSGRIIYSALSLALLGACALILEYRRKGVWLRYDSIRKAFARRRDRSPA